MLLILSGPPGSGKSTLARACCDTLGMRLIYTLTDRPARNTQDTKHSLPPTKLSEYMADPDSHRVASYDGFNYVTPIGQCRQSALDRASRAVVDWVHPHPEDLSFLGAFVVAIVLLPSAVALEQRLRATGRPQRVPTSLRERSEIAAKAHQYQAPWHLWQDDLPLDEAVGRVAHLFEYAGP